MPKDYEPSANDMSAARASNRIAHVGKSIGAYMKSCTCDLHRTCSACRGEPSEIESLKATIAQLQAELAGHADGTTAHADSIYRRGYEVGKAESAAEIERLRSELSGAQESADRWRAIRGRAIEERDAALELLREALVPASDDTWRARVRAALEEGGGR